MMLDLLSRFALLWVGGLSTGRYFSFAFATLPAFGLFSLFVLVVGASQSIHGHSRCQAMCCVGTTCAEEGRGGKKKKCIIRLKLSN
jgi:hypothetical protein